MSLIATIAIASSVSSADVIRRFPGQLRDPTYGARVQVIGDAIDWYVGDTREYRTPAGGVWTSVDLRAAIVATFWEESGFRRSIHSGRERGDRGSSICLGQIRLGSHPVLVPRERWIRMGGTSIAATRECVAATAEVLLHHADRCGWRGPITRWQIAGVYTSYGTGRTCRPDYDSRLLGRFGLRRAARWVVIRGWYRDRGSP